MEKETDRMNPPSGHPPTRLSEDLRKILNHADGKAISIRSMIDILHGRGFDILAILLSLPFCSPIPSPGLSTVFGLVLMLFGLRIALRKRPWLPNRILKLEIPYSILSKMIEVGIAVAVRTEKIFHPRLRFFKRWPSFTVLNGLIIFFNAFLLTLPLPIPFTNMTTSLPIILLAVGMMEEDGAIIVLGYLLSLVGWGYFIFLAIAGEAGIEMLLSWFSQWYRIS